MAWATLQKRGRLFKLRSIAQHMPTVQDTKHAINKSKHMQLQHGRAACYAFLCKSDWNRGKIK